MSRRHIILSAFFFNPRGGMSWRHPRGGGELRAGRQHRHLAIEQLGRIAQGGTAPASEIPVNTMAS
ncbi:hypothetical protein [Inquilinus limosus]|uniref:hypothetical protein n=1 Tax=Inquilinus limosus TaxID=171674 RepID=UPI0011982969|nr:hypothetical protein [Inquilinus limosus]